MNFPGPVSFILSFHYYLFLWSAFVLETFDFHNSGSVDTAKCELGAQAENAACLDSQSP